MVGVVRHLHQPYPSHQTLLTFWGYYGIPQTQQQNSEKLLERAEIPHKQIKYGDANADEEKRMDFNSLDTIDTKSSGQCLKLTNLRMSSCNSKQNEQKKFDCTTGIWRVPFFNLHITQQKQ